MFEFIDVEKTSFPIALHVPTAGCVEGWLLRVETPSAGRRAVADARISKLIHQIHAGSRGTYGAPRIHAELGDEHSMRCGRKRVARLCASPSCTASAAVAV